MLWIFFRCLRCLGQCHAIISLSGAYKFSKILKLGVRDCYGVLNLDVWKAGSFNHTLVDSFLCYCLVVDSKRGFFKVRVGDLWPRVKLLVEIDCTL